LNTGALWAGAGALAHSGSITNGKERHMLYTIVVVLLILWLLGLVTSYTLGGVIHVLLVIALVMLLVNFISGRRGHA
jgi:hypothetical protein